MSDRAPASAIGVDQLRLTQQAIQETRVLREAIINLTKVNLDLTEAIDALREQIVSMQEQLSNAKIDLERTLDVDPPPPEDGDPLRPPEVRR